MTRIVTDQLQRRIELNSSPQKIVSLVPSLTELLVDLGLKDRLKGITKYCVHPESLRREIKVVGGTKDFSVAEIQNIAPDLIIASKEENTEKLIGEIAGDFPVYVSDIKDLNDALYFIREIGEITETATSAKQLASEINTSLDRLNQFNCRVAYLIWRKPYMTVGGDTFIHDMLGRCGFINVFGGKTRYPIITPEDLLHANPDFVFLSSEPYPFKEKHMEEMAQIVPDSKIILVDGEYFSWYGSRLRGSVDYFNKLIKSIGK